ncbi:SDR family NAD(P)-dependent oxidoreductase [Nitrospirillum amazonense]|uniref:SDR family NAD(P)-dependent oxidoreductase n=1 Tax=Nitrospirillum amazonense TaxID=28077 RepID=UPI002412162F|nr:SDR family oxidoreductase [Nitrospirillum amazonense]MDG3439600.1 SDR family NAD(P)-dependent oxidoreductase [Nitrospirillum amazonense]
MEDHHHRDKTMARILIIGSSAGLGRTVAQGCRADGGWVAMADGATDATGPWDLYIPVNPADPEAPARAMEAIRADQGALDAVVVAASLVQTAPVGQWTAAMWDEAAAINLRLPFLAAQAALDLLGASPNASIIFISSTATLRGQPLTHAYQATKAGLAGLVRSLAAELGPRGIRVNGTLVGWVDTPQTRAFWSKQEDADAARQAVDSRIPLRRHGGAEEAAALVRYLISPAASYVTGTMIPVDGGDTAV